MWMVLVPEVPHAGSPGVSACATECTAHSPLRVSHMGFAWARREHSAPLRLVEACVRRVHACTHIHTHTHTRQWRSTSVRHEVSLLSHLGFGRCLTVVGGTGSGHFDSSAVTRGPSFNSGVSAETAKAGAVRPGGGLLSALGLGDLNVTKVPFRPLVYGSGGGGEWGMGGEKLARSRFLLLETEVVRGRLRAGPQPGDISEACQLPRGLLRWPTCWGGAGGRGSRHWHSSVAFRVLGARGSLGNQEWRSGVDGQALEVSSPPQAPIGIIWATC